MSFSGRKGRRWNGTGVALSLLCLLFLLYPFARMAWAAFSAGYDSFTLQALRDFFTQEDCVRCLHNSLLASTSVTALSLILGIPFACFLTLFNLRGHRMLWVLALLCAVSAPFIDAFSLNAVVENPGPLSGFLGTLGIGSGSLSGLKGIVLAQTLKLFPLAALCVYMALRRADCRLAAASASLGGTGIRRILDPGAGRIVSAVLPVALLVFMEAFADFGTPAVTGGEYRTLSVFLYESFHSRAGGNLPLAAVPGVLSVAVGAALFMPVWLVAGRRGLRGGLSKPACRKKPKGFFGLLMHLYCYVAIAVAVLPKLITVATSFFSDGNGAFSGRFSLANYASAMGAMMDRSIANTILVALATFAVTAAIAVLAAYSAFSWNWTPAPRAGVRVTLPYAVPGAAVALSLMAAYSAAPVPLAGTVLMMVIALSVRVLPYAGHFGRTAVLWMPAGAREASTCLGASRLKTFAYVMLPHISDLVMAGALFQLVFAVTEVSGSVLLFNTRTMTLALGAYTAISQGSFGTASAFSAATTAATISSLALALTAAHGLGRIGARGCGRFRDEQGG